jgi:pilus assembly protein Flp/PilA
MDNFYLLIKDEKGVTAIEYALIAALIAVASILTMQYLGGEVEQTFNYVGQTLNDAQPE